MKQRKKERNNENERARERSNFKRQSNGVANILGGQTGGNLICWGEMFPTTPNMFLSNNIHKNSIFHAFFKF